MSNHSTYQVASISEAQLPIHPCPVTLTTDLLRDHSASFQKIFAGTYYVLDNGLAKVEEKERCSSLERFLVQVDRLYLHYSDEKTEAQRSSLSNLTWPISDISLTDPTWNHLKMMINKNNAL